MQPRRAVVVQPTAWRRGPVDTARSTLPTGWKQTPCVCTTGGPRPALSNLHIAPQIDPCTRRPQPDAMSNLDVRMLRESAARTGAAAYMTPVRAYER